MLKRNFFLHFILFIFLITYAICSFATESVPTNEFVFDNTVRKHPMNAIQVPERDINLRINNLSRDAKVYLYIPTEMLRYNMEKFLNNNLNNDFLIESWEADDIKELLDNEKFIEYVKYLKTFGFKKESNEIELRHYSFCIDSVELLDDYVEYNGNKYVSMKVFPNEDNEFKIITKDYFVNYNSNNILFMIDEYGAKTYIDLTNYSFTTNPNSTNITEMNIDYDFQSSVDPDEIERITTIVYLIIYIILLIVLIIILSLLIKHHIRKKEELEERKFWKKKLTKEEKKAEKKRKKEEQKELLKEIKNKKHKKK